MEFSIIWQPKNVQDLLRNLILIIFLDMIPCCLPLSCRECLRAQDYLNITWQPKAHLDLLWNSTSFGSRRAAQDLLWNLLFAIFLEMIPCCLPLSCRKRPILFTIILIHDSDNPSNWKYTEQRNTCCFLTKYAIQVLQ